MKQSVDAFWVIAGHLGIGGGLCWGGVGWGRGGTRDASIGGHFIWARVLGAGLSFYGIYTIS